MEEDGNAVESQAKASCENQIIREGKNEMKVRGKFTASVMVKIKVFKYQL